MTQLITAQAAQTFESTIAAGGLVCVTICAKFTPTVTQKVLTLLAFAQSLWVTHDTPEQNRKLSVYFVLCYYNGLKVPEALMNVEGLEIITKPQAQKYESPLSREFSLAPLDRHMGLFRAGPDYFGLQTIVEESVLLLNSDVGTAMVSYIFESIGIDGKAAVAAIKAQAETRENVYKTENIIPEIHQLIQNVHATVLNMDDEKYRNSLMFLAGKFDELAKSKQINHEQYDFSTMSIGQLINFVESHVDSNNPKGLVMGVLSKAISGTQRLDDGTTLQSYAGKEFKVGYALGKLLVSTLSRKQLLGSRLDFEQFFEIFHHMNFESWAATFAESVDSFINLDVNKIRNIVHLQIQDGEADDMSYRIMGHHLMNNCPHFKFFSAWQISMGGNPENKNLLWDYVQNPESEIRRFMQDDVFFPDPDSTNQRAVLACMPNLAAYLQSLNMQQMSNVSSSIATSSN